eukprot:tig00020660_g12522.t1
MNVQIGQENLLKDLRAKNSELEAQRALLERQLQSEALLRSVARSIRTRLDLQGILRESAGPIRALFDSESILVSAFRAGGDRSAADKIGTEDELQVTGFLAVGWEVFRDRDPHEIALFEAVCDQARCNCVQN